MASLWKTLYEDMRSWNGDVRWELGQWRVHEGPLVLCRSGFHASPRIIDAMRYLPPAFVARVEVQGEHQDEGDKQVWREMRVVQVWPWSASDSVALAVFAAEQVIGLYEAVYGNDPRPRQAIEAAKPWIEASGRTSEEAAEGISTTAAAAAAVAAATMEAEAWAETAGRPGWAATMAAKAAEAAAWSAWAPEGEMASLWVTRAARAATWVARAAETSPPTLDACEAFIRERLAIESGEC